MAEANKIIKGQDIIDWLKDEGVSETDAVQILMDAKERENIPYINKEMRIYTYGLKGSDSYGNKYIEGVSKNDFDVQIILYKQNNTDDEIQIYPEVDGQFGTVPPSDVGMGRDYEQYISMELPEGLKNCNGRIDVKCYRVISDDNHYDAYCRTSKNREGMIEDAFDDNGQTTGTSTNGFDYMGQADTTYSLDFTNFETFTNNYYVQLMGGVFN